MTYSQTLVQNVCRNFLRAIASQSEIPVASSCTIMPSQLAYESLPGVELQAAIDAHPLRYLLGPPPSPVTKTGVANCHDFAWALKQIIDERRRNTFVAQLATLPNGFSAEPFSIGLFCSRTHVVNIAVQDDGGSPQVVIVDTFQNPPSIFRWTNNTVLQEETKIALKLKLNDSQVTNALQAQLIYF